MSLKKIKKALTMVLTASVALSAAGCGKDVAKNNMTEEKTVETLSLIHISEPTRH